MTSEVLTLDHGSVVELRFNRPDKKNAITGAMYDALTAGLAAASGRDTARVVLLSAEGDTFSAGNDIADFLAMPDRTTEAPSIRFIHAIAAFDKPVVVAVGGPAIGVGTTLLLHCDLVYAGPDARFVLPFVDLGLVPEAGSSVLLPAAIGLQRAAAMLLLGEPMDAPAAQAAGLVNAVVATDALHAHALAVAQRLAAKPPGALMASRSLMRRGAEATRAHMRLEEAAFHQALQGAEAQAAFAGFLARRDRSAL